MALHRVCFDSKPSVGNVNDVALLGQLPSTDGEIIAFVFAGMLLQNVRIGASKNESVPTVVVFLAIMNVRP